VTLVRLWLAGTAVILVGVVLWAFAPMLVFVALLIAALGGLAVAVIGLARQLRAWRGRK
jgi:hypothetical protein